MTRSSRHKVAAAALISEGRVLLCRRRADLAWYPGVWDLVGGHLEEEESSEQAVIRECWEELGIRVTALAHLASETSADADIDVFTVSAWIGEPTNCAPQEHAEIAWFSAEELPRLDLSDRRLVSYLLDLAEGRGSRSTEIRS